MFGGYLHLRSLAFVIAPIPYAVVGAITSNVFYEHGTRPITNLALFILVKKNNGRKSNYSNKEIHRTRSNELTKIFFLLLHY